MSRRGWEDFWDAVFEIRKQDDRYAEDAYVFVMDSLEYAVSSAGVRRHVSARELLGSACQCAKDRFGLMAWTVLERWGVRTTSDVGALVYQLIDAGVLAQQEGDSREEFDDVFDLQTVLEDDYFEPLDAIEEA